MPYIVTITIDEEIGTSIDRDGGEQPAHIARHDAGKEAEGVDGEDECPCQNEDEYQYDEQKGYVDEPQSQKFLPIRGGKHEQLATGMAAMQDAKGECCAETHQESEEE